MAAKDLLAALVGQARISAQDVIAVRGVLYPDMTISAGLPGQGLQPAGRPSGRDDGQRPSRRSFQRQPRRTIAARFERRQDADIAAAAPVNADEAHWLIGQIGRDGVLDDNEVALLLFVADTAETIDPSLKLLIAQAEAKRQTAENTKPVFGHRGVA